MEFIQSEEQKKKSENVLRHHQADWYIHYKVRGDSEGEEREKGTESLFKEKWLKTFQTWGKKQTYRSKKTKISNKDESEEIHSKTHYN